MMHLLQDAVHARRRLPLLICLAALALLAGMVPAVAAATGKQSVASQAPSGSRCSVTYVQSALHLADVTVDSAAENTTGSFTSTGQPTITGKPDAATSKARLSASIFERV